ncbi:MAG: DUF4140 domain-containing protein, partial [Bacteroidota bacterium]
MQLKQIFPAILVIMSVAANAANDPKTISSDLKTVTVYRSGAEMVHNASTQLLPGNNELVIDGISNTIDINSVQINCPAAVTILSVEFANNYLVAPEVNARITSLKDSSEKLQREIDKINVQLTSSTDLLDVLKANR